MTAKATNDLVPAFHFITMDRTNDTAGPTRAAAASWALARAVIMNRECEAFNNVINTAHNATFN